MRETKPSKKIPWWIWAYAIFGQILFVGFIVWSVFFSDVWFGQESTEETISESSEVYANDFAFVRSCVTPHMKYPKASKDTGDEGHGEVLLLLQSDELKEYRLTKSSGSALLDKSMLDAISRAKPCIEEKLKSFKHDFEATKINLPFAFKIPQ